MHDLWISTTNKLEDWYNSGGTFEIIGSLENAKIKYQNILFNKNYSTIYKGNKMDLLKWFRKPTRKEKIIKECGCVTYCSKCKDILNDQKCKILEHGIYEYTCKCGRKTVFDFNIAPVPIMVKQYD